LQIEIKCHQSTLRLQFQTLKCTKIDFGWGSAPDDIGGAQSATSDPLAEIDEGESREGKEEREGKGKIGPPIF
jgi:hypothetical protein